MPQAQVRRQLYEMKQQIARMRRYALPVNRIVESLLDRSRRPSFRAETLELIRDVHDHTLRINEQVHSVSDLADAVLDLNRSAQSDALNEAFKKLTGWGAIIAVPTYIASVYGMNFELIPDEASLSGFFFAIALMLLSSGALYVLFKRRNWI